MSLWTTVTNTISRLVPAASSVDDDSAACANAIQKIVESSYRIREVSEHYVRENEELRRLLSQTLDNLEAANNLLDDNDLKTISIPKGARDALIEKDPGETGTTKGGKGKGKVVPVKPRLGVKMDAKGEASVAGPSHEQEKTGEKRKRSGK